MPVEPPRYYYLENFQHALCWLQARYADLLSTPERQFLSSFAAAPPASRALLVRLVARQGCLFRASRLAYEEIGCTRRAAGALLEAGLLEEAPELQWSDLERLATRAELASAFPVPRALRAAPKARILHHLRACHALGTTVSCWLRSVDDVIYRLVAAPICTRLRMLFFGNFRQDWSEYVLTDLGIHRYESVPLDGASRAFTSRTQIDQFAALYRCREWLHEGAPAEVALAALPAPLAGCPWIEARRVKLLMRIGHLFEKSHQSLRAADVYATCDHPEARIRTVRMLEKLKRYDQAWLQLGELDATALSEAAAQQMERLRSRLGRRLGKPPVPRAQPAPWPTFHIQLLRRPATSLPHSLATGSGLGVLGGSIERRVARCLESPDAPVWYVENTLINTLLGLLCWEAIFAPLPGAFFHPFQAAPADWLAPDFCSRRTRELHHCLGRLHNDTYRVRILDTYDAKQGIAAPLVAWTRISRKLLELALECMAPAHLQHFFGRILADIGANRSGLPDLIQFFPARRAYRLIEVKGPADRLQSNQIRWLGFCAANAIEVAVCKVAWAGEAA